MRWQIGAMLVMVLMNLAQGQTQPSGGSSSQVVGTEPTSQKAQTPPVPRPSPLVPDGGSPQRHRDGALGRRSATGGLRTWSSGWTGQATRVKSRLLFNPSLTC
jgi:hypothetical protein